MPDDVDDIKSKPTVSLPFPEFIHRRTVIDELCNFLYFDHYNKEKLSVEDTFYLYCIIIIVDTMHLLHVIAVADFLLLARLKSLCEVELSALDWSFGRSVSFSRS